MSRGPTFGSFNYVSASAEPGSWDTEMPIRAPSADIPRSDIARSIDGFLAPRVITLKGRIGLDGGSDLDTYRGLRDAFLWAHRGGRRALQFETDRQYPLAQVESLTLAETNLAWAEYTLRFRCADPYAYALTPDTDTWSAPANAGTRSLTNSGAATALPAYTITVGATGALLMTLSAAGGTATISGAVTSGDVLVLDCAAETLTRQGSNSLSYLTAGNFFPLVPGANTLTLALSGVSLTSIASSWLKRWL